MSPRQQHPADEISIAETARRLGVSFSRAHALIVAGKLQARQVAGHWLVDAASVEQRRRRLLARRGPRSTDV